MIFFATCKFGLESLVSYELKSIGAENIVTRDACVYFEGAFDLLCRANIWLRTADRVFLQIGRFEAKSFDELYEGVKALSWEDYIELGARFPVKGKSALSQLKSVSDCQAITKKAIADRLMRCHKKNWLKETGNEYIVEIGLLNNIATVALDSSGAGLARRGYRTLNAEAPLSEVLSAALVQFSRFKEGRFIDPMCGSGTIAIEAAMIASNIAPGLNREFAANQWSFVDKYLWKNAKEHAIDCIIAKPNAQIEGRDIDRNVIELAKFHAKNAGVKIGFGVSDIREFKEPGTGCLICNPPYGERLMGNAQVEELYKAMGGVFKDMAWKWSVLTPHQQFERLFGKRADKRRKLYNSGIACQYYQYFTD